MAAVDKSQYEIFLVESNHNDPKKRRTVDISQGVVAFTYFENIMSPTLTARAIVVNTGGGVSDDEGNMVGVYNGLPFRGGERVIIKIASNSNRFELDANVSIIINKKILSIFKLTSNDVSFTKYNHRLL